MLLQLFHHVAWHVDGMAVRRVMNDNIELTINGQRRLFPAGLTVADLLGRLELNPQQVAVEVNLEIVPRESHASHGLMAGDRIEVMTLVGGG